MYLHLEALKNLNQPVEHWDVLIIHIISKKIDLYTVRGFHQERTNTKAVPSLSEFLDFLEKRAVAMEISADERPVQSTATPKPSKPERSAGHTTIVNTQQSCEYCLQIPKHNTTV